jgi:hypothetical protein
MARPEAALRTSGPALASAARANIGPLRKALADEGVTLVPLFGLSEERLRTRMFGVAARAAAATDVPDLSRFYQVDAPPERLEAIAERLREMEPIEAAYVKPGAEPAQINDMAPAASDAPPVTPSFESSQGYLNAAPGGIDARFAWTRPGGTGANVRIIDIEGAWRFTHEDLGANQGGVIGGTPSADIGWRNHGTAVIGEFSGDRNGIGVTGICPDATVRAVAIFGTNFGSAKAIRHAADALGPGDILLIELHRPGPRNGFAVRNDQRGYVAVEWWPDDLAAIQYAIAKGVIVVEAAGNGFENLDDAIYDTPAPGFPATWRNPYRRTPVDSGAIVIGAGAPPSGNFGADRSRLDFSNFGALVDAQGWGREVVTCGYGNLQGGTNEDLWYTNNFSGTSSASPIVVGAIACLQGVLVAAGEPALNPAQVRNFLRNTGSLQQNGPSGTTAQRVGNRPDLRALIDAAVPKPKEKEKEDLKDVKEKEKDKEKEFKEKEKDSKDFKDKEKEKDGKEVKERIKEFKEIRDKVRDNDPTAASAGSVSDRVSALEQAVGELSHFISADLRPDLSTSALGDDRTAAKQLKDEKDTEKLPER